MDEFSPEEREKFRQTLVKKCTFLPGDPTPDEVIDYCERVGFIADAGIGSLLKGAHATGEVERVKGSIAGFVARFDNAYFWAGGTREFPSLMLGAKKTGKSEDQLPCIVTKKSLQKDGQLSAQPAIDFITTFEKRENPPEHTDFYRRRFVRVQPEHGEPIIALVCENNPDNPLFVGDKLTTEEKAILMANEWGAMFRGLKQNPNDRLMRDASGEISVKMQNPAMARTMHAYLLEIIDGRIQHEFPVEDELWELVHLANFYREQMPQGKRLFLQALDSGIMNNPAPNEIERSKVLKAGEYNPDAALDAYIKQHGDKDIKTIFCAIQKDKRALDPRVFESLPKEDPRNKTLSPEEYNDRLWAAREKMRAILNLGPLPESHRETCKGTPIERARIVRETDVVGFPPPEPKA